MKGLLKLISLDGLSKFVNLVALGGFSEPVKLLELVSLGKLR